MNEGAATAFHQNDEHVGSAHPQQRVGRCRGGVVAQLGEDAFALGLAVDVVHLSKVFGFGERRDHAENRVDTGVVERLV